MGARAIQVLPDHVIDQIAAGEVIERPASVVKELVENALDAGARQVTVEVARGGRELIRVLDDGAGMSGEEARMALVRHATSKLRALEDLAGLTTMGFRGEALPSIAAVSRMVMTTRERGAPDQPGTRLMVEAGRVVGEEAAGSPPGTLVEVRDLLFNLPARLKFLKGEATETAHASEAVARARKAGVTDPFELFSAGARAFMEGCWQRRDLAVLFSGDGPPGFEVMRRRRGREWLGQNDALLRLSDTSFDRLYVTILTTLIGEGSREVAAARSRRQAGRVIDAVIEYVRLLMTGGAWWPAGGG